MGNLVSSIVDAMQQHQHAYGRPPTVIEMYIPTYESLRDSGCISLPAQTIFNMSIIIQHGDGAGFAVRRRWNDEND